jgi:pSer/pThr/pTyr-binding forkhead associated (FHA) protein
MKVSLIVLTAGKMQGKPIPINFTQFLIGRDFRCHLRPANPVISNRHCAILIRGTDVFVHDFESTNGTFVNGEQVKGEKPLKDKDRLRIGPLEFDVSIEALVPIDKKTPVPPAKAAVPGPDDEAAAALLLSLQDDGSEPLPASRSKDEQGVPMGTTVMEMPAPSPDSTVDEKKEGKKDAEKKDKKPGAGDTSTAANALLQKYLRRPRKE